MADLVELLDLGPVLRNHNLSDIPSNFEEVFATLYETDPGAAIVNEIESRVREYFDGLRLPDTATLYDRLILSLQPRDVIATFNWDPLLYLAYRRNIKIRRLPSLAALHGSVAVGVCEEHRMCGYLDHTCSTCAAPFAPSRLLYPIRRKNYQSDSFIAAEWDLLRSFFKKAYWITIFGYSAPSTDVEAVRLLTDMALANEAREIGNVEIIDIKSSEELYEKWTPFFVRSHYGIHSDFSTSSLARNPRRTAETLWRRTQLLQPVGPAPFPETEDLSRLQAAAQALIADETPR